MPSSTNTPPFTAGPTWDQIISEADLSEFRDYFSEHGSNWDIVRAAILGISEAENLAMGVNVRPLEVKDFTFPRARQDKHVKNGPCRILPFLLDRSKKHRKV